MTGLMRLEGDALSRDIVGDLPAIFTLAKSLVNARGFIPSHYKNENEVAAAIIAGRELGIPPMLSLRVLHVINGKVGMDASLQLAMMKRAGLRHKWIRNGEDKKRATLWLQRAGDEPYEQSYTIEEATDAGLLRNPTWKTSTAAMLRARCVSAAGRAYCPDVVSGVYVPDELTEMDAAPAPVAVTVRDAADAAYITGPTMVGSVDVDTGEIQIDPIGQLLAELPQCTTDLALVVWFQELDGLAMPNKAKRRAWDAWGEQCNRLELDPSVLANKIRAGFFVESNGGEAIP
jgi:hypothetical protein